MREEEMPKFLKKGTASAEVKEDGRKKEKTVKKEKEPQFYGGAVDLTIRNYHVYYLTPKEKIIYGLIAFVIGALAGYLFYVFKKLTSVYRRFLRKLIILRAVIGGLLLGIAGTFLPLTMFSGEHQMEEVFAGMKAIGALTLLLVAVVKLLLTNVCIDSGLKGGHFFPVIFSGICIGCSLSILFGISAVFCAAMVTTALVAHTLKKPLATVLLLMIVFPPVYIPFMLAAAFISVMIPTARPLLPEE